jgi:hypothetical protein
MGVLYFVMRDTNSDPDHVYSRLFDMDGSAVDDASRCVILESFSRIRVFCLPEASSSLNDMRSPKFDISRCSPQFVALIGAIRRALVMDCVHPRMVQGVPLNGVMAARTVADVVEAINTDAVNVFPGNRADAIVGSIIDERLQQAALEMGRVIRERVQNVCDPDSVLQSVRRAWWQRRHRPCRRLAGILERWWRGDSRRSAAFSRVTSTALKTFSELASDLSSTKPWTMFAGRARLGSLMSGPASPPPRRQT